MSGFTDMMIDDGFSDPQDYMDYLEDRAMQQMDRDYYEEENYSNSDEDDYSDEDAGCGKGYSCSQCSNYGCPKHPCN